MIGTAGARGFPPTVTIKPYNPEKSKYQKAWTHAAYRKVAPGEHHVLRFLSRAKPPAGATVIDFGAGTGRGSFALAQAGLRVTAVDFAGNCLDPEVAEAVEAGKLSFLEHDLTALCPVDASYGFCTDVMEHIPPENVRSVLENILTSANMVYFAISTVDDVLGKLIGEPLHLTVQPAAWWEQQLTELGATVLWSEQAADHCCFLVSSWRDAKDLLKDATTNVDKATIDAQVKANIEAGWRQVRPFEKQDREVVLLCGGPSMADHVDDIRELRAAGAALVTVNGAYGWALDKGLEPSAQIVLDAREFNSRFVQPVTPYTKYLIASQAHPRTFEGLPWEQTEMWHSGISEENQALLTEFYPVPGGSTVVLRAIPLLRLLGFWRMHLFGFDSCVRPEGHHAYSQPENDGELLITVDVAGQSFTCAPWMLAQATEFRELVRFLGDEVELAVHGDGLIAAMIKAGAELGEADGRNGMGTL